MLRTFFLGLLGAAVLSLPSLALAGSAQQGLTGLSEMRSPHTIGGWQSEVYLAPRYARLTEGQGNQFLLPLGITQGLGDDYEVGLQIPIVFSTDGSGLHSWPLLGKWHFLRTDGLDLGATAFLHLPLATGNLVSGQVGVGGELNISIPVAAVDWVTAMSLERTDYGRGTATPGVQTPGRQPFPIVRFQTGVRYDAGDQTYFAETQLNSVENGVPSGNFVGDQDWRVLLGARIPFMDDWAMTYHAGIGLYNWTVANQAVIVGARIHYFFDLTAD
jgi:hypothetical protein